MDVEVVLGDFFKNFKKLEALNQEKNNELSKVDVELSVFYHELESIHLSHNTQAHAYMVKLKDILARRRQLKKETILIRSFVDSTKQSIDVSKQSEPLITKNHCYRSFLNKYYEKSRI